MLIYKDFTFHKEAKNKNHITYHCSQRKPIGCKVKVSVYDNKKYATMNGFNHNHGVVTRNRKMGELRKERVKHGLNANYFKKSKKKT